MIGLNTIGELHVFTNHPLCGLGVPWHAAAIIAMAPTATCTSKDVWIARRTAIGVAAIYTTWAMHRSCAWSIPRIPGIRELISSHVVWQGCIAGMEGVIGVPMYGAVLFITLCATSRPSYLRPSCARDATCVAPAISHAKFAIRI